MSAQKQRTAGPARGQGSRRFLEKKGAIKGPPPISHITLTRMASRKRMLSGLASHLDEALAESKRSGAHTSFRVEVDPSGRISLTPIEARPRANPDLDAGEELRDAIAEARRRGAQRVAEILAGEEMLSGAAFAAILGTTRMTVNTWRAQGRILGLEGAKRGYRYPAWQLDRDGKPFAALPELFDRLGGSPWEVYRFLIQQHPELNGLSAREALARGQDRKVIEVAESVARDFA